jgi:hypothetical protein
MTAFEDDAEEPVAISTKSPYRAQKNWGDASFVQKGGVAARIQKFSHTHKDEEPQLTNTGRTNPSLKKKRWTPTNDKNQHQQFKGDANAFHKQSEAKARAATKIQAAVRVRHAQKQLKILAKQAEERKERKKEKEAAAEIEALARAKEAEEEAEKEKERQLAQEEKERQQAQERLQLDGRNMAAIKIQAAMRSALTRVQVCKMVETLIADMMRAGAAAEKAAAEEAAFEQAAAAKAEEARRRKEEQAEAEQAAAEKAAAEDAVFEQAAAEKAAAVKAEEARRRKEEQDVWEAEEAAAEDAAFDLAAAEKAEASRRWKEEAEKRRMTPRSVNRSNLPLFEGPLPWGVALMPQWWMETVPHKTRDLEAIDEELDDFDEWRLENLIE